MRRRSLVHMDEIWCPRVSFQSKRAEACPTSNGEISSVGFVAIVHAFRLQRRRVSPLLVEGSLDVIE
jgi:hypothetical protein